MQKCGKQIGNEIISRIRRSFECNEFNNHGQYNHHHHHNDFINMDRVEIELLIKSDRTYFFVKKTLTIFVVRRILHQVKTSRFFFFHFA